MKTLCIKHKVQEWLKRYLLAEILSFVVTLIAAGLTFKITGDQVSTALSGTWAGNIAYFGYILLVDVIDTRDKCLLNGISYTTINLLKNIRALALEFGVAEIFDSFFIRPTLMYYVPIWVGSLFLGISIAKIAADFTFYIPAIISYELSKRYQLNSK
jgi:hypothetical protein